MKQTVYVSRSKEEKSKKVYNNFSDCFLFDCFICYGGLCLAVFLVFTLFLRGWQYAFTQYFNVHSLFSFKVFEFLMFYGQAEWKVNPFSLISFTRSRSIVACFQKIIFSIKKNRIYMCVNSVKVKTKLICYTSLSMYIGLLHHKIVMRCFVWDLLYFFFSQDVS